MEHGWGVWSEMTPGLRIPIDHGHDIFTVERGEGDYDPEVVISLWSRGSFEVQIGLRVEDALAFAEALRAVATAPTLRVPLAESRSS